MVAIDTNVAVRLLVNDDPAQTTRAVELFQANQIFVAKTVILEVEWVLRGVYLLGPKQVNESLRKLLSLQQVVIEDEPTVFAALDANAMGMDFADALHQLSSRRAHAFASFDASFRARSTKLSLNPPMHRW